MLRDDKERLLRLWNDFEDSQARARLSRLRLRSAAPGMTGRARWALHMERLKALGDAARGMDLSGPMRKMQFLTEVLR